MEIVFTKIFYNQLEKCPNDFLTKFRKVYQQLKIVDNPLEVKGITSVKGNTNLFKLNIDISRIGLEFENDKLFISCFLNNQYFNSSQ